MGHHLSIPAPPENKIEVKSKIRDGRYHIRRIGENWGKLMSRINVTVWYGNVSDDYVLLMTP